MNRFIVGFMLVIGFGLASCDDDSLSESNKGGARAPSEPFLDSTRIAKPSTVTDIESIELVSRLNDASEIFLATLGDDPSADGTEDEGNVDDVCYDELFGQGNIIANGTKVTISMRGDLAACLSKQKDEESIGKSAEDQEADDLGDIFKDLFNLSIDRAIFSIYLELDCEGKDFTELNGSSILEFEADAIICENGGQYIMNSTLDMAMTYTIQERTISGSFEVSTAESTANNEPCELAVSSAGVYTYSNECQMVRVEKNSGFDDELSHDYLKIIYGDVSWEDADHDTWYSSGTMQVELNNWTGTMAYSGPYTAPQYSLTDGANESLGSLFPIQSPSSDNSVSFKFVDPSLRSSALVERIKIGGRAAAKAALKYQ